MDLDFQAVLNNRKFKCLGVIRGVKIIDRSKNLFNNLLEEVLDQLYLERLLEDGKCIVCQVKTSKCCSNCGTNYCSAACQASDWLNHKVTCTGSQSRSTTDSLYRKPAQLESSIINNNCDDGNADLKSRAYQRIDAKLETPSDSRYSSFQDISHFEVRSTGHYETDTDTSKENPQRVRSRQNKRCMKFKQKKTINKARNRSETEDTSAEGKENKMKFERRIGWKKLVPGQKLKVKRMSSHKNNYWVIDKRDAEKFEEIQNRLESEWKTYVAVSDLPKDLCAFKYNHIWYRCKVLCLGEKTLLRCVDTGNVFCPKHIAALELPDDLKAEKGLAFDVCFEDSVLPEESVEWLDVQVLKLLPKGVYSVKLCEKIQKEPQTEEVESSAGEGKKIKKKKKKKEQEDKEDEDEENKWIEEGLPEKEETKPRRSVLDELKPTAKGIFVPGKIGKQELLGSLTLDDVNEAMCCYNKITGLYLADGSRTDGNVGDDVMVAGDDSIGHRGIIKSKSGNTYKVQLVDYGYIVETNEVFKMPEKTADMMQLACRVTLLNDPPRRYDEFEVKRAYVFEVIEKRGKDDWLCKFSVYPDLNKTFACGIVDRPWKRRPRQINYIPFENNCEIVITGVDSSNGIHIKRVDENWDELLEELNLKLNQYVMDTVSDLDINDLQAGDIVVCQYKQDELWYRAKVVQKRKNLVNVVFVDYGNFQFSTQSELRSMPEDMNEPFFSRRVTLAGSSESFSPQGREYLLNIKKENRTLILSYSGEDISEGVILFDKDGTNINEIVFKEEESTPKASSLNAGFDEEKFLISEGFPVGVVENFVCLYMDKDSFRKHGIFWAVNPESSNFKYVIELGSNLSKHCESDSEKISPETGMLCIAKYQEGWYRGLIVDIFGPLIEVFFVDFGNVQVIDRNCIRKMVPEFFQTPATAVKCFVNGFDKLGAAGIPSVEAFITDNLNKTLKNTAEVVKVVDEGHYIEFRTK